MNTKQHKQTGNKFWQLLFFSMLTGYTCATLPVNASPFAYVTHNGAQWPGFANSLSIIDMGTTPNTVVESIPLESHAYGLTVSPDGKRIYVAVGNYVSSSKVVVIDASSRPRKIMDSVSVWSDSLGPTPFALAASPDGKRIYAAMYGNGINSHIAVIDTTTQPNTVVDRIFVEAGTISVVISPDGKRVYAANIDGHSVSVIDTTTTPNRVLQSFGIVYPSGLAVSPDGKRVYVTEEAGSAVSVIDTTTSPNTIIDRVTGLDIPRAASVSPDGKRLYVTEERNGSVAVIDTTTRPNSVIDRVTGVSTGFPLYGIAVSHDGSRVYVANYKDGNVPVIDTKSNTITETIPVDVYPWGIAISPQPVTRFKAFDINLLKIGQRTGNLFLLSNFVLDRHSNGINPVGEVVTLKVGCVTITIPANSFQKKHRGLFTFTGQINGMTIEAVITPLGRNRFGFKAAAHDAHLGIIKSPVAVELTIGNDIGTSSAKAVIKPR